MRLPRTSSGPSIRLARSSCSRHDRLLPCFPSRRALHPRLRLRTTPRRVFGRGVVLLLARPRLPWYLLQALLAPQAANARVQRFVEQRRNTPQIDASADAAAHLVAVERLLLHSLRLAF